MDPVATTLTQYGAVGVIALASVLVARALYTRLVAAHAQEVKRLEDSNAVCQQQLRESQERERQLHQELTSLNEAVRNEYLHTLARSNQAIADASRAVAEAAVLVRRR